MWDFPGVVDGWNVKVAVITVNKQHKVQPRVQQKKC